MIEFKTGDILKDDAEALVNTVNCVGVMGRGVALQFKHAFPGNFKSYEEACRREEVQPGRMFVYETGQLAPPRYIINFPTKRHWRGKSRMDDIDAGMVALIELLQEKGIRSVAIPPLGSGLGGLNWADVRSRIEKAVGAIEGVRVVVYEPQGAPEPAQMSHVREVPAMTPGRAALVGLMHRYLGGLLDPFVTLLEVHKLLYFMQEAGEPLRLSFAKAPYGPYAANLRHVLNAVEGHLVSGYADGGDAPEKQLQLVPGAMVEAEAFLKGHEETLTRFERVAALVDGFESPYGLELLSTVHWLIKHGGVTRSEEVIAGTHEWNSRKRCFTRRQIILAINVLSSKGWIERAEVRGG